MAAGTSLGSFHPLVAFADLERGLAALPGATIALEGDATLLPLLAELAESIGAQPVTLPPGKKSRLSRGGGDGGRGAGGRSSTSWRASPRKAASTSRRHSSVYLPLTRQALANAESLGIAQSLTGPFLRGDAGTIADHLDFLKRTAPEALPVYLAIARRELEITRRRATLDDEQLARLERLLDGAQGPE